MRVLVTGSRDFADYKALAEALDDLFFNFEGLTAPETPFTVVHGGAAGADSLAGEWCRTMRELGYSMVHAEVHRADWKKYGKIAGLVRNQKMVELGAHICLAFPRGLSRGTRDCITRAENHAIPVRRC